MAAFSANPTRQSDLLGFDTSGELRLVVEVKARIRPNDWQLADRWLEEVAAAHSALYCMFVTSEFIALRLPANRRRNGVSLVGDLPLPLVAYAQAKAPQAADFLVETRISLDLAIDTQRVPLHRLDSHGLTRTVDSWLESCLWTERRALESQPFQRWLVESELYDSLVNGRIAPTVGGAAYAFVN